MRIISIELNGFKSFARAELFTFPEGVTGVVGPNGCGKSNVIDATRWVLGEQSRKDLRMKSSTDVIFGGTANRRGARSCSVVITFDNADGTVASMGAEFSVERRLQTSGESSYKINGHEAKLRDVRDLFRGTGIGPDGYTIMSQGKIDALLQANPIDRRKVFEEAAGIAGYRAQKLATERKLEIVASNLQRLDDKIGEARTRLRAIKGQASRALKFREYSEKLRVLRTRLALQDFHGHNQAREELLLTVNDLGREEGRLKKSLTAHHLESESIIARLSAGEKEVESLRKTLHEVELAIGFDQGKANEARARIEGLRLTSERMVSDIQRLKGQVEELGRRRNELASAKAASKGKLEDAKLALAGLQQAAAELHAEGEAIESELSGLREKHIDSLHQRSDLMNEKLTIEAQQKSDAQRRFRLEKRAAELCDQRETLLSTLKKIEVRAAEDAAALEGLAGQAEGAEATIADFNRRLGELRGRRHQLELQVSGTESRIAHLEEIEQMLEGVEAGSRRLVQSPEMSERFGVQGLMADLVSADIKVAPALERALGRLSESVVVATSENAFDAIDWLTRRAGEASTVVVREHFAALAKSRKMPEFPTGQGILGSLVGEVKCDEALRPFVQGLLGEWLLVADRDVARRVVERHGSHWRLVTVTGEVFDAGAASLPSSDRTGGVITQRSELERLRREREHLVTEREDLGSKIVAMVEEAKAANEALAVLRANTQRANLIAVESRTELLTLTRRSSAIQEEIEVLASEQEEIWETSERDQGRLEEIEQEIAAVSASIKKLEQEISARNDARAGYEARRRDMTESLTSERVHVAELESNLSALEQSDAQLLSTLNSFGKRVQEDEGEVNRAGVEVKRLEAEIDRLGRNEVNKRRERDEAAQAIEGLQSDLASVRERVERARAEERKANAELLDLKERAADCRVQEEKHFLAMNNLREKLMEDYSVDLDTNYREYDPKADRHDPQELTAEIEVLHSSLKRLGNVNMEAVGELEEVEERYNRFSSQQKDLVRAKKALEDAIAKIETEARKRFLQTFETARGHFQRLFRKMFGGGSADIILLNPEDILESGIEVMAKPPGMEPKSLNLLSGGQRTMIAVAMMFALFETCRAPFALLDEVDAALDEANVDRFCTVLKEYASSSQFIIITHHKKTMVNCDRLYGITMQERGVSKKVHVDLSDPAAQQVLDEASVAAVA